METGLSVFSFSSSAAPSPRAALTDELKLGGFQQKKFTVAKFWRPEVRNQSVSRGMASAKPPGGEPHHAFLLASRGCLQSGTFLAGRGLTPISTSVVTWRSPWRSLSLCPFLLVRTPIPLDESPPRWLHLSPVSSAKILSTNRIRSRSQVQELGLGRSF